MTQTRKDNWLSALPLVGYDVAIALKDGSSLKIPWCRIHADGKTVHFGVILGQNPGTEYPTIMRTMQMAESDIREIVLRDEKDGEFGKRFRRPAEVSPTGWLKDLPKSRNCHISVFCKSRDDCKEVHKGWISYDDRKIHLVEIISSKKVLEVEQHDRNLEDVVAIIISVNARTPQVFVRC